MDEITALGNRITDALDRARRGLERMGEAAAAAKADAADAVTSAPGEDAGALRRQLDEERTVTAQLEERVRALKDRQDSAVARLEAQAQKRQAQVAELDAEIQRLAQANADLRAVAVEMREALAAEVAEPELVNRAMQAELDALRAVRDTDRREVDAVIAELKPLIGEAG